MNALVPLYDYYIIMYPVWLRRTAEVAATTAGSDDVTQQYFVHTHDADDDDTKTSVCVCVAMALNIICIQECVIFWQQNERVSKIFMYSY